jgi:hypothetical protein
MKSILDSRNAQFFSQHQMGKRLTGPGLDCRAWLVRNKDPPKPPEPYEYLLTLPPTYHYLLPYHYLLTLPTYHYLLTLTLTTTYYLATTYFPLPTYLLTGYLRTGYLPTCLYLPPPPTPLTCAISRNRQMGNPDNRSLNSRASGFNPSVLLRERK